MASTNMKETSLSVVLNNETRKSIIEKLLEQDMHITKLSREIGLSIPAISRHIRMLEDVNLVKRKVHGKSHVFSAVSTAISKNTHESQDKKNETFCDFFETINEHIKEGLKI